MFRYILKNPILSCLVICLLFLFTAGIFFNRPNATSEIVQYLLITVLFISCCRNYVNFLTIFLTSLFFVFCYFLSESSLFLLFGYILITLILAQQHKNFDNINIFIIISITFFWHLYYVQHTLPDVRQHDLNGIIFYIQQITLNGFNFIKFNPWDMYYSFHQPLHFIISGYIYILEFSIWNSHILSLDGLQYLSLFYVTGCGILAARILKQLQFDNLIFLSALIFFAFNPTFFLFSGYLSDDASALFWTLLFLYNLIYWYKTNYVKYILLAALFFSIGCLTKLSILLLVPATVLLFLQKLIASSKKQVIIKHLCWFVIISVPLSLLWIIRNHILYDMPFYNVPDTSPLGQNFNYLSFYERIFDFSFIFYPFINVPDFVDPNIWLSLVKTELFGEWNLGQQNYVIYVLGIALYIINIILKITSLCGCIFIIWNNIYKKYNPLMLFFVFIYLTVLGYSFKYSMDYPYVCSSDYRLFVALLLPEIVILSSIISITKTKRLFFILSLLYATLGSLIYTLIL